jgi:hypothetical protein
MNGIAGHNHWHGLQEPMDTNKNVERKNSRLVALLSSISMERQKTMRASY